MTNASRNLFICASVLLACSASNRLSAEESVNDRFERLMDQERFDQAEALAKRFSEERRSQFGQQNVMSISADSYLARVYEAQGKYDVAKEIYKNQLARYAGTRDAMNSVQSHRAYAKLLKRLGELDQAYEQLKRAESKEAEAYSKYGVAGMLPPDPLAELSTICLELGRHAEARTRAEQAVGRAKQWQDSMRRMMNQVGANAQIDANTWNLMEGLYTARPKFILCQLDAIAGNWKTVWSRADESQRTLMGPLQLMRTAGSDTFLNMLQMYGKQQALDEMYPLPYWLAYERREESAARKISAEWIVNRKARMGEMFIEMANLSWAMRAHQQRLQQAGFATKVPEYIAQQELTGEDNAQANRRRRIEQDDPRKRGVPHPWVELPTLQAALPENSCLISIARFSPLDFDRSRKGRLHWQPLRYVAWLISANKSEEIEMIDLGEASEIDELVERVRDLLKRTPAEIEFDEVVAAKTFDVALSKLSEKILLPIETRLSNVSHWYLSPDAQLWLVPWVALKDKAGKYLVESKTIHYVTSGRELCKSFALPDGVSTTAPVVVANPRFAARENTQAVAAAAGLRGHDADQLPRQWQPLPGTDREGHLVREYAAKLTKAPVVFRTGGEASERFVKTQVVRPLVFHLATHGFFLSDATTAAVGRERNPLKRCGLVLAGANDDSLQSSNPSDSDGLLLGMEVANLDLRGTELVVLSACDTALGDVRAGDGVAGLRQAFQIAGVKRVLSSLWKVDDAETATLIPAFFEGFVANKSPAEALRVAQLKAIRSAHNDQRSAHPFYWAALTITGP